MQTRFKVSLRTWDKKLKELVLHLPCPPVKTCSLFQPGVFGKWLRRHDFAFQNLTQCLFYWEKLHNIGTRTLATKEPNHPTASQSSFLSPAEATMSQTYCLRHPA